MSINPVSAATGAGMIQPVHAPVSATSSADQPALAQPMPTGVLQPLSPTMLSELLGHDFSRYGSFYGD